MPCCRDVFVEFLTKTAIIQHKLPCRRDVFVESLSKSAIIQQIGLSDNFFGDVIYRLVVLSNTGSSNISSFQIESDAKHKYACKNYDNRNNQNHLYKCESLTILTKSLHTVTLLFLVFIYFPDKPGLS